MFSEFFQKKLYLMLRKLLPNLLDCRKKQHIYFLLQRIINLEGGWGACSVCPVGNKSLSMIVPEIFEIPSAPPGKKERSSNF